MARARATDAKITQALAGLAGWAREGGVLVRRWQFADFGQAFAFMARVALLAEKQDHHPEWTNVYNRLEIRLSTHDAGGISAADFRLARAINELG